MYINEQKYILICTSISAETRIACGKKYIYVCIYIFYEHIQRKGKIETKIRSIF